MSGTEDYVIVNTPPFAESVTEGDIRWDKGTHLRKQNVISMLKNLVCDVKPINHLF